MSRWRKYDDIDLRTRPIKRFGFKEFFEEYDWLLKVAFPADLKWYDSSFESPMRKPLVKKVCKLAGKHFDYSYGYYASGDLGYNLYGKYRAFKAKDEPTGGAML